MKITLQIFLVLVFAESIYAQQSILVEIDDIVELEADAFRGELHWQQSSDQINWTDITNGNVSPFQVTVTVLPVFFRGKVDEEACDGSHYTEVIQVYGTEDLELWSDPNTWGEEGKPVAGDEVVIPKEKLILLDENTPELGGLTIEGLLTFDRQDLSLTSKWIVVNGILQVGTSDNPFRQKATITLNDQDTESDIMGMGTRGIMVMNGVLELHGATPDVIWTKINAHAESGATVLSLIEEVDWNVGDEIVIAPTDYYEAGFGASVTQRVSLSGVNEDQLNLADPLNAHRWGLLQYPVDDGMSLSSAGMVSPPVADTESTATPLVLDERAEVGHLTRNIVIQSPDDDRWQSEGFGVHTMIMPNGTAHVEGVEFKRAGQAGRLRRYPFHWHMLSYEGTETFADANGQYFNGNTINSSANRGIVIHGTNGVEVRDNIVYDVRGHGVFTEDAIERRNIIDGNLVLHVRNPATGSQLMQHEVGSFGSSGFWIANPDNTVTNNIAADCQTFGFWLAFPLQPFGLGAQVLADDGLLLRPNRLLFGVFDNNTAHSNKNDGLHLDDPQSDDEGNTFPLQYWSSTTGRADINDTEGLSRFTLARFKTWKNMDNGSWDRGVWTDMIEFVSADNCGRFFAGSGAEGVIERGLIVGTSLNFMMNGTGRPEIADFQFNASSAPTAFATYHSAFSMKNNILVNFEVTEHDRAGVFASDDYYLRAVDKGMVRNTNNLMINSHPGVKLQSTGTYFTLASALWDPYGFWGPEENYFVYDVPFLTYGKEIHLVELGTEVAGGVSVAGPFYGFAAFVLHGVGNTPPQTSPDADIMALHVDRYELDDLELSTVVGTWEVDAAESNWTLQHMRDFATTPDGLYVLTFPGEDDPTDFLVEVESMIETTDTQVIGIQYDGNIDPVVYIQQERNPNNFEGYEQLESLTQVIDSEGETWWQDKTNNRVWVKIQGGRWEENEFDTGFERVTNETMQLKIRPAD
ncbi:Right handed beta helix region [Reichenbachiella faecimaris]|uniref:Right handed beta helix region n=1 Tax=Reichenbachiella faecimaris TaxID=692418 RepID=A0A1W2GIA9_REIFA|nr:G8 domain-containing protein [Reichenbachiella faecimaris]SMD36377.1 Right handed beta helix region [Reichenbachiella faecimaris]